MSAPIPHWPGEEISLGDRRVHIRTAPARRAGAEPAVFVHGLGGAATNWTDLMGELAGDVAGTAVDLPGFGHSPPPPDGRYTVSAHSRTVADYLEARGDGPAHLFGNSLGGAVTVRLAARRPDLVRTLTLVSPALPDLRPRLGPSRIVAAGVPGIGSWALRRLAALPPERRVRATIEMIYADPRLAHPDRLAEMAREMRRRDDLDYAAAVLMGTVRGIIGEFTRFGPRSLWRDAARVTAPTLLIYGRRDRIVDPRNAARARRVFRDARVVEFPDAGHVAQMERPEAVAREFRALLGDRRAGTR